MGFVFLLVKIAVSNVFLIFNVTFLMVGRDGILGIFFEEDSFPTFSKFDINKKLLDIFFLNFIIEMNNNSSWNCIFFNPALFGLLTFQKCNSRLISTNMIESFFLKDIQGGEIVLSSFRFIVGINSLGSFCKFAQELVNISFLSILLNCRDYNCSQILNILQCSIDWFSSEINSVCFEKLISSLSFLGRAELDICPSSTFSEHGNKACINFILFSLILDKSFKFFCDLRWVFIMLSINVLNMKNI
jgi:hypothetical protein